jgi:hypothetical protein
MASPDQHVSRAYTAAMKKAARLARGGFSSFYDQAAIT